MSGYASCSETTRNYGTESSERILKAELISDKVREKMNAVSTEQRTRAIRSQGEMRRREIYNQQLPPLIVNTAESSSDQKTERNKRNLSAKESRFAVDMIDREMLSNKANNELDGSRCMLIHRHHNFSSEYLGDALSFSLTKKVSKKQDKISCCLPARLIVANRSSYQDKVTPQRHSSRIDPHKRMPEPASGTLSYFHPLKNRLQIVQGKLKVDKSLRVLDKRATNVPPCKGAFVNGGAGGFQGGSKAIIAPAGIKRGTTTNKLPGPKLKSLLTRQFEEITDTTLPDILHGGYLVSKQDSVIWDWEEELIATDVEKGPKMKHPTCQETRNECFSNCKDWQVCSDIIKISENEDLGRHTENKCRRSEETTCFRDDPHVPNENGPEYHLAFPLQPDSLGDAGNAPVSQQKPDAFEGIIETDAKSFCDAVVVNDNRLMQAEKCFEIPAIRFLDSRSVSCDSAEAAGRTGPAGSLTVGCCAEETISRDKNSRTILAELNPCFERLEKQCCKGIRTEFEQLSNSQTISLCKNTSTLFSKDKERDNLVKNPGTKSRSINFLSVPFAEFSDYTRADRSAHMNIEAAESMKYDISCDHRRQKYKIRSRAVDLD